MEILYQRGKNTFLVKEKSKVFFVSLSNKKVTEIDDITAQELLQSGFWNGYEKSDEDKKIREELSSLIRSI